MSIERMVEKEFGLPPKQLKRPIRGDILSLFDIQHDISPEELNCGLVLVDGLSYGGGQSWWISAHSAHPEDNQGYIDGDEEAIFGSMRIFSDSDEAIEPSEALLAAEDWIRTSRNTQYVPNEIKALDVPKDSAGLVIAGLILVRAANVR